ncbi:MAG: NADH-quinone oxidoreductase subunit N, partial [Bacteroidales bacterium]|nr:NADH-quinone oxidoreductase subunit N [Bacteroidales bacterium]
MNFTNFLMMHQEAGLVAIFLFLFLYDAFGNEKSKQYFRFTACFLFGIHTFAGFIPLEFLSLKTGTAFGGMYVCSDMTVLMKNILNIGTLLVLMQSGQWLRSIDIKIREGEFYIMMLATLFGMYMMVSAANFMLLYIGIEAASLPLACLVAYNKYQDKSAEAGAKFILISALSSGIMLFGISFLYGAAGTMYFSDMAEVLTYTPMTIMGLVFFFAGLGFKISLVP